ncbi:hypothetical protein CRG98_008929 [Punica granatum]|uniref:Myeloid leukemia factor 1 n=1 Tax=Punica granatum TaxID=22663 RepID=A0A2I0KS72_PUNGR|nr:hypothetical protein CRG98_008929 [Punica granatum]
MQGNRGGRDPFMDFGGPFGGPFGSPFGGFGGQRSLISSFFGGRDPFDDPFFTQPFGGMFGSSFLGSMPRSPFMDLHPGGFIEHNPPQQKRSRGPIIEELNSDDEQEAERERKGNPRKHARSTDGLQLEGRREEDEGRSRSHVQSWDGHINRHIQGTSQPQGHSYTFQSSTVTYGGANGAYYTSSTTRRTGSDGVSFEESKEADSSTLEAAHRVSRGLNNRGHSVMRKLKSDGRVDAMETLHNLNQGGSSSRGAWALPSTDRAAPKVAQQTIEGAKPPFKQASGKVKPETSRKGGRSQGKTRGQ